jgi:hypothetical protein
MPKVWKKGRGKLGFLDPLMGEWSAETTTPMGPVQCLRTFTKVLGGTRVRLEARWAIGPGAAYEELALIGVGDDDAVCFWSLDRKSVV